MKILTLSETSVTSSRLSLLGASAVAVTLFLATSLSAVAQPETGNGPPAWAGGPPEWAGGPPPWADDDDDEVVTEDQEEHHEGDEGGNKGNNGLRQAVTDLQQRVETLEALLGSVDLDGDGYTGVQGDCNDADPLINPDAIEELGDGVDNDCDSSTTDDGSTLQPVDGDGDGFFADDPDPALADCNDSDALVNPGAEEIPDNLIDDNCDGAIDETV
ncbi:putative metal-binding motif-containing protein [Haliea sp. E1-2-M8]|uniref:putative metal-binding motif-containing protein n=1 Tax=Haliea sp. E1-2-M8 TaxID=3064706 RepID=UPI002715B265|nr:putative metal-binding motif-containing protein [Haliea sp. E1-2-M8]MDO8864204.1 putative metal-binding motif-containing protein [Haliea sp. E1-2-M8]